MVSASFWQKLALGQLLLLTNSIHFLLVGCPRQLLAVFGKDFLCCGRQEGERRMEYYKTEVEYKYNKIQVEVSSTIILGHFILCYL